MLISKIISGGRSGVERGAIQAAWDLGIPYGGTIPQDRLVDDGIVPMCFDKMEESASVDEWYCIEHNVLNSDCTLIISRQGCGQLWKFGKFGFRHADLLKDGESVVALAAKANKPHKVITYQEIGPVLEWLETLHRGVAQPGLVVNVFGLNELLAPGISASAKSFLADLVRIANNIDAVNAFVEDHQNETFLLSRFEDEPVQELDVETNEFGTPVNETLWVGDDNNGYASVGIDGNGRLYVSKKNKWRMSRGQLEKVYSKKPNELREVDEVWMRTSLDRAVLFFPFPAKWQKEF